MIRIVLAEDQTLVLDALAALLSLENDLDVVGTATDGELAIQKVKECKPNVLITDIEMPRLSGLDVAAQIREISPQTKVMIVTTFGRAGYLRRALDVGAKGYLLKDTPASELAEAIRQVYAGGHAINGDLAAEAWSESDPLTERERQVLREAETGASTTNIAKMLGLSEGTVRNYLSEAISKLAADNRIEAARIAREKGWL